MRTYRIETVVEYTFHQEVEANSAVGALEAALVMARRRLDDVDWDHLSIDQTAHAIHPCGCCETMVLDEEGAA